MAYIRRREHGGKVNYYIGFKAPDGRWRERVAGPRRKDAELLLTRVQREIAEGTYGKPAREDPVFAEFAKRFLKAKRGEVKPSTLTFYERTIESYLLPHVGKLRLSGITPSRVQQLLIDLEEEGKSPATRSKALRTLRVIMRWALSLELIDRDPTAAIRAPRIPRKEITILTPPQFNRLLEACDEELRVLVAIAGMAGLREGEAVALRWGDIDFRHGVIRVSRNYFPGHGFSDLKSKNARRQVPILPALKAILEELYRSKGEPPGEELILSNSAGKPLDRAKFYPRFKRASRTSPSTTCATSTPPWPSPGA